MGIATFLATPLRAIADCLDGRERRARQTVHPRPSTHRPRRASAPLHGRSLASDREPSLLRDLHHRRAKVRARAARSIGELGMLDATDAIAHAAGDRNRLVRRAALGALLKIDPGRFAETALWLARQRVRPEILADLDSLVEGVAPAIVDLRAEP